MCSIFNNWENPSVKLPCIDQRVLVVVKSRYGGNKYLAIAEYVPKYEVFAEDFLDPDCDEDFCDIGDDGREYVPEGWYESTYSGDHDNMIDGEVMWWAKLPAAPLV